MRAFASTRWCFSPRWLSPLMLTVLLLGVIVGCESRSETAASTTPPPPPPSPEVRFEKLLAELERRLGGDSVRRKAAKEGDSGGIYTGGYQITDSELVPPETSQGVYRATITIREQASFTVISLPNEDEQKAEEAEKPNEPPIAGLEDLYGDEGIAEQQAGSNNPAIGALPIQTQDFSDSKTYELAYVEGRWRLKTKIPDNTFMSGVFELSLKRQ